MPLARLEVTTSNGKRELIYLIIVTRHCLNHTRQQTRTLSISREPYTSSPKSFLPYFSLIENAGLNHPCKHAWTNCSLTHNLQEVSNVWYRTTWNVKRKQEIQYYSQFRTELEPQFRLSRSTDSFTPQLTLPFELPSIIRWTHQSQPPSTQEPSQPKLLQNYV